MPALARRSPPRCPIGQGKQATHPMCVRVSPRAAFWCRRPGPIDPARRAPQSIVGIDSCVVGPGWGPDRPWGRGRNCGRARVVGHAGVGGVSVTSTTRGSALLACRERCRAPPSPHSRTRPKKKPLVAPRALFLLEGCAERARASHTPALTTLHTHTRDRPAPHDWRGVVCGWLVRSCPTLLPFSALARMERAITPSSHMRRRMSLWGAHGCIVCVLA